jgi:hypothetical protein
MSVLPAQAQWTKGTNVEWLEEDDPIYTTELYYVGPGDEFDEGAGTDAIQTPRPTYTDLYCTVSGVSTGSPPSTSAKSELAGYFVQRFNWNGGGTPTSLTVNVQGSAAASASGISASAQAITLSDLAGSTGSVSQATLNCPNNGVKVVSSNGASLIEQTTYLRAKTSGSSGSPSMPFSASATATIVFTVQ